MLYYVKGHAHLVQGILVEGIMHAAFSRVGRMEVEVMVVEVEVMVMVVEVMVVEVEVMVVEVLMGSLGAVGL